MTDAAQKFITPLSVGALAGEPPYIELFDAHSEFDVGHIRLAREPNIIIVAPATADLMAKIANGLADDLASAVLLATDKKILLAPAMNPNMWSNKATRRNRAQLAADDVMFVGPKCRRDGRERRGRGGTDGGAARDRRSRRGAARGQFGGARGVFACSSPPVRPMSRSIRCATSPTARPAKQGHAIAEAAAKAGANVTLVSGPVNLPDPRGVNIVKVESARDMLAAVEAALPADVGVFAAAVADWRSASNSRAKIKKTGKDAPELALGRKSRHPLNRRAPQDAAAEARDRLCRRNRARRRARQGQARAKRLRLDPRQRRLAGNRHHGRRQQHHPSRHPGWRGELAAAIQNESLPR